MPRKLTLVLLDKESWSVRTFAQNEAQERKQRNKTKDKRSTVKRNDELLNKKGIITSEE